MSAYQEGSEVAGRFIIKEKIGEGGMGSVYRSLQVSLDREVALKVLHAASAFTARARRRFAREARAIARLNHPHIAGVYDFGVDDAQETLWLAMEFIQGKSMTPMKREPIDLMRLLSLTDQMLSALASAHARGIIHRDLKPSNVLISQDAEGREIIKLVDFGLAASYQDELDLSNAPMDLGQDDDEANDRVILGTPRYMAPEIFKRQPVDPRVDVYALGVMLFEILAGKPPYPGDDPRKVMKAHLNEPIPQLIARDNITLPAEFEGCIYKMLAKDPVERFQSANDVREVIAAVIAQFSYVPWMAMGPRVEANNFHLAGNLSGSGFITGVGGQTVAPAAMYATTADHGAMSMPVAPLVGRKSERQTLEKHIRAALREDHGSMVFLVGEAGVGKSRLMEWVRVRVEESGVLRCAQGRYTSSQRGFHGVRAMLSEILGVQDFPYDDLVNVLTRRLEPHGFAQEEITLLARLLQPEQRSQSGSGALGGSSLTEQERAFAVIERILRQSAKEKPLLLLLENIHDAGEATLAFLEHLAVGLHLTPAPIVMIASVRAEEVEQVGPLKQMLERLVRFDSQDIVKLGLKRLSHEDATSMIQKLATLDEALVERLAQRAEGNPLLITQMLRFLQESQKLQYDSGRWRLVDGVQITREIPDEIADMMRYRASQVCRQASDPEVMRAMLDRCAVLGARFSYALLRHLLSNEPGQPFLSTLDARLEELISQGILREVGHSGQDLLEFDHGLMRDVLLQDLHQRRSQRQLHKLAAQSKLSMWETLPGGERALEIVEHYKHAKDPHGVYEYTLRAARAALNACDLKAAMRLFRQAEELAESVLKDEGTQLGEQPLMSQTINHDEIALEVAHLSRRLGDYEPSRQAYRKLLNASDVAIGLWARWGLGELSQRQGDFDEAIGWYESARREAIRARQFSQALNERTSNLIDAYCLFGLGYVTMQRGDYVAANMTLGEALERTQRVQERALEIPVLLITSEVVWRCGDRDRAEIYRRRALMLIDGYGDKEIQAVASLALARQALWVGEVGVARQRIDEAQEAFEALGKRHYVAHCLLLRGKLFWLCEESKEAAKTYRQAHRFYEMFHDRRGLTECKALLAALAMSIRRYPDAQTLIRDALEGYRAMHDRAGEAWCRVLIGRLEFALQKYDKASRTFMDVVTALEELGDLQSVPVVKLLVALSLQHAQSPLLDDYLRDILPEVDAMQIVDEASLFGLTQLSEALKVSHPAVCAELEAVLQRQRQLLGQWRVEAPSSAASGT